MNTMTVTTEHPKFDAGGFSTDALWLPSSFGGATSKFLSLVLISVAVCLVMGVSSVHAASPFTIIGVPDIENETQDYPVMLQSQVDWIVNNRASQNIAFVAQQGDLTSLPTTDQFSTASNKLFQISSSAPGLPWGVLPGNHDFDRVNYINAFGPSKFAGQSWYGGAYNDSSYQTFAAGGRNYLMIDVEYNPSVSVLDWAQSVITANPGIPTIINTHDYLNSTGGRSSMGDLIFSGALTGNPDGLVYGNSQVFMVLCGHNFSSPWNQTSIDKAGQPVFENLADYQNTNSGDGYLRLYQFDETNSVIHVSTYSPYDATTPYLTDSLNQFDISMDFNARLGVVPEPTILCLLAVGGVALLMHRRKVVG